MNKDLLRSHMVKNHDTQQTLAEALGISLSCLNAKINSTRSEFRQSEILEIKNRYRLTGDDVADIFLFEFVLIRQSKGGTPHDYRRKTQ